MGFLGFCLEWVDGVSGRGSLLVGFLCFFLDCWGVDGVDGVSTAPQVADFNGAS